jgi:hypothetical protein
MNPWKWELPWKHNLYTLYNRSCMYMTKIILKVRYTSNNALIFYTQRSNIEIQHYILLYLDTNVCSWQLIQVMGIFQPLWSQPRLHAVTITHKSLQICQNFYNVVSKKAQQTLSDKKSKGHMLQLHLSISWVESESSDLINTVLLLLFLWHLKFVVYCAQKCLWFSLSSLPSIKWSGSY